MTLQFSISRVYQFSAAHRLHSVVLDDGRNRNVYGKCNNLYGHGHNYIVEVTIKGQPSDDTGMIIPLSELDQMVQSVLDSLNYKHLDNEVPFFKSTVSSGENIIRYLWQEINKKIPDSKLYHIKLWETNNNTFELGEEN
jgi:6-pyruvoyltetrahydropterin/6-carboxytetrahydropterin synthase